MARKLNFLVHASKTTLSGYRFDQVPYTLAPPLTVVVQWIVAVRRGGQPSNGLTNSPLAANLLRERHVLSKQSKQNKSAPTLWHAVVCGVEYVVSQRVTELAKTTQKALETNVLDETGDILHHKRAWSQRLGIASKLSDKIISGVYHAAGLMARAQAGKSLAGRTACEEVKLAH